MFKSDNTANAEKSLWQSVLLTTIEDALIGVTAQENKHQNRIHICKSAREYLTKPSRDLSMVCNLAGMDMQSVIERMKVQISNAPTPEELANGPRVNRKSFTKKAEITRPKRIPFKDREFTIKGETRTAQEWCERTGIPIKTAHHRLNHDWSAERAFFMTQREAKAEGLARSRSAYQFTLNTEAAKQAARNHKRNGRAATAARYEYNGQSLTLKEWSEATGIKKATLDKRLRSGWSFHDAITTSTRPKADAA